VTADARPDDRQPAPAPLDEKVDHVRGSPAGHVILEYGDYECPYSRQAIRAVELVEQQLGENVRFAFRHFPLTGIHPHALAAARAAEAPPGRTGSAICTSCCSTARRRSKTATCACTPPSLAWTWRRSTATGPAPQGGADPPGCGRRRGLGPGAGHANPVHRRHRPPRRLRPAHPCWPRWPHEPPCSQRSC
jgi:Thioredoxin